MKILAIICLVIVIMDMLSAPFKYMHDRLPRPAWKKSYAMRFAIFSAITDVVLILFILSVLRGIW